MTRFYYWQDPSRQANGYTGSQHLGEGTLPQKAGSAKLVGQLKDQEAKLLASFYVWEHPVSQPAIRRADGYMAIKASLVVDRLRKKIG